MISAPLHLLMIMATHAFIVAMIFGCVFVIRDAFRSGTIAYGLDLWGEERLERATSPIGFWLWLIFYHLAFLVLVVAAAYLVYGDVTP